MSSIVSSVPDDSAFTRFVPITAFSQQSSGSPSVSYASTFASYFQTAADSNSSDSTSSSSSSSTSSSSSSSKESGLDAFMAYAKETPAERMFDSWLRSQGVTMEEYKAMTPEQKQKYVDEYKLYEKQKLKAELGVSSSNSMVLTAAAVSQRLNIATGTAAVSKTASTTSGSMSSDAFRQPSNQTQDSQTQDSLVV